jgi:hypothetical protein
VVHRQLSHFRLGAAALAAVLFALVVLAAPAAQAANRRVAIGHYQWSIPKST